MALKTIRMNINGQERQMIIDDQGDVDAQIDRYFHMFTSGQRIDLNASNAPGPMSEKTKEIRKRLIGMAIINCTKAGDEIHIRYEADDKLPPAGRQP